MQHSVEMARMSDVTVRDNPAELRYEARRGDILLGQIRYRTERGLVVLVHTDVASSAEGGGVGSALVAGALDDIRSRGLRVVPVCPFVAAYIRRHLEYADLVAQDPAIPD
jgi:predicted GNAT family acetyltransferase